MSSLMSISKYLIAAVLLSVSLGAVAREATPIILPPPITVPSGKTMKNVKDAIFHGLATRGWTGREVAPGMVEASFNKENKHTLVLNIKYDTSNVTISYKDSVNLKYQENGGMPLIHGNANKWMNYLAGDIQRAMY